MKRIRIELTKQDFHCYGAYWNCPIENYFYRTLPNVEVTVSWLGIRMYGTYYSISSRCVKSLKYDEQTLSFVVNRDFVDRLFGDKKSLVFYAIPEQQ